MKISKIQIINYRSITEAKLSLSNLTVLLGKNNEGKSNILMAVNIAISTLQVFAEFKKRSYSRTGRAECYSWERDYPVDKQNGRRRDKTTSFILEFSLDPQEIGEFKKKIGHQLNGALPIKISIGKDNRPLIKVVKRGKGSRKLNEKSQKIAKYISERIGFNYIPAVRTAEDSLAIINRLIASRLQEERKNSGYRAALENIASIEQNMREKLGQEIEKSLSEFLPSVKSVKLEVEDLGSIIRHRQDIVLKIDDGTNTDLMSKGDGVKSIVAMSLLKNQKLIPNSASVIAIEEPESHLHPSAIETLRNAIIAISAKSQIIISTHNPKFVNQNDLSSNVIVDGGNATKAENIRKIREVLGVKLSDNLYGARLILYVEGPSDVIVLIPLLQDISDKLKNAIKNNELIVRPMHGTDHLEMHVLTAKTMLADFFVLLDQDPAGTESAKRILEKGLMSDRDYMLTAYPDMKNQAEMEDMLDSKIYQNAIKEKYGVDISNGKFKARHIKWSDRIESMFQEQGKVFTQETLNDLKFLVANLAASARLQALRPEGRAMIDRLVETLEKKLEI